MKVYTKTGDKGSTSLFGGKRVPKHHLRIDAYGTVDELNAHIGLVRDSLDDEPIKLLLKEIQDRLFTVGAILAADPEKPQLKKPDLVESDIQVLEKSIDEMESELPALTHFVLPGGHVIVSYIHIARTVCRRSERLIVALNEDESIHELVIPYINRLSDYLFVLSRWVALRNNVEENKWVPRM